MVVKMGGFLKGRRLTTVAAMGLVVLAAAWPAHFSYYPTISGSLGAPALAHGGALALAALAPFSQRRGISR